MKAIKSRTLILCISMMMIGCPDETPESSTTECTSSNECTDGLICFQNTCQEGGGETTTADGMDVTEEPTDEGGTTGMPDIVDQEDVPLMVDIPTPDLLQDNEVPKVDKVEPGAGGTIAIPFKITITFNRPVKNVGVDSVEVRDVNGAILEGVFAQNDNGDVWTFEPKPEQLLFSSPYTLNVNAPKQVILAANGKKLNGIHTTKFFTGPPENLAEYHALALKFAPTIQAATRAGQGHLAIPTRLNVDGDKDWDLKNNLAWFEDKKNKTVKPAVHYTVLESESHFFIHYVFYFSQRDNSVDDEDDVFENDASGAVVMVEKWDAQGMVAQRAVEVATWFRTGKGQYVHTFATDDSGIKDSELQDNHLDKEYARADLFPDDRFMSYISAGDHESCLWNWTGNGNFGCEVLDAEKATWDTHVLTPADKATAIQKINNKWVLKSEAAYELVDMLDTWWPRRTDFDGMFHEDDAKLTWKAPAGMKTTTVTYPTFFIDAAGDTSGRTPFGVLWKPGDNSTYQDIDQGLFFFDTPNYLTQHHKGKYFTTAWAKDTKKGFAKQEWCFNPYFGIDNRGVSEVCP